MYWFCISVLVLAVSRRPHRAVLFSDAEMLSLVIGFLAFFSCGVTVWYFVSSVYIFVCCFFGYPELMRAPVVYLYRGVLYHNYLRSLGCVDESLFWISNSLFFRLQMPHLWIWSSRGSDASHSFSRATINSPILGQWVILRVLLGSCALLFVLGLPLIYFLGSFLFCGLRCFFEMGYLYVFPGFG